MLVSPFSSEYIGSLTTCIARVHLGTSRPALMPARSIQSIQLSQLISVTANPNERPSSPRRVDAQQFGVHNVYVSSGHPVGKFI